MADLQNIQEPKINWDIDTIVSYSQFSMYQKCPKSWELAYGRKLRTKEPNIHLVFGTAMHITIQEWLTEVYEGRTYDYIDKFQKHYYKEFAESVKKWEDTFSSTDELMEFYEDGVAILQYIDANFDKYFNPNEYEYIGYEIPIYESVIASRPTVKLMAYLDLVFKSKRTGIYEVKDIKTSTKGWGKYQVGDRSKISQVLLYKFFFSTIYNIDIHDIMVDYVILKRKINTKYNWGTERVQMFAPEQSPNTCTQTATEFTNFVEHAFNEDGSPNLDSKFMAITGQRESNCRFCDFVADDKLCPMSERYAQ